MADAVQWERVRDYEDIIYEKAEGIARVTINRPEVRNAFRPQTVNEMIDAFEDAREGWVPNQDGSWQHLCFEVESVDDVYAELSAKNIPFRVLPKDIGANPVLARNAFFQDPDGNDLELYQPIGNRYPQGA